MTIRQSTACREQRNEPFGSAGCGRPREEENRRMEEIFDVVDEEGQPTGETISREEAHARGIRHRTAHIWVIRKTPGAEDRETPASEDGETPASEDGETASGKADGAAPERYQVLLQKRAMDKDSFPGQFDTSSAGHIHAGDEPRISAVRELGEELGIHVKPDDLMYAGRFSVSYEEEFHGKPFLDNEVAFVYVCGKPVELKDLKLQEEEVEEARWFGLEETWEAVKRDDPRFCVPPGGLKVLRQWLQKKDQG